MNSFGGTMYVKQNNFMGQKLIINGLVPLSVCWFGTYVYDIIKTFTEPNVSPLQTPCLVFFIGIVNILDLIHEMYFHNSIWPYCIWCSIVWSIAPYVQLIFFHSSFNFPAEVPCDTQLETPSKCSEQNSHHPISYFTCLGSLKGKGWFKYYTIMSGGASKCWLCSNK